MYLRLTTSISALLWRLDTTTTKNCVSDWLRLIWLFDCLRWRSWNTFSISNPLSFYTVQLSELSPQIASWCWKDCSELINVSCSEQSKTIIANFPSPFSPVRVTCELWARTGVYGQEWVTTTIESSLAQSIIIRSSYTTSKARERLPTPTAPVEGGGGWWYNCDDHNIHSLITSSPLTTPPSLPLQKIQNYCSACLCLLCNCYKQGFCSTRICQVSNNIQT